MLRLLRMGEMGVAWPVAMDSWQELHVLQAECYHAALRLLG